MVDEKFDHVFIIREQTSTMNLAISVTLKKYMRETLDNLILSDYLDSNKTLMDLKPLESNDMELQKLKDLVNKSNLVSSCIRAKMN